MANPLLKWAGGKRWIVSILSPIMERIGKDTLVELFAGGAALSLKLEVSKTILNDKNIHLMNFYNQIRKGVDIFSLGIEFGNDKEIFYKNRSKFNALIKEEKANTPESAALFYYLNKTAYNGLMRFNSKGFFNTPFGKYKKINYLFEVERYRRIFENWIFTNEDFADVSIPKDAIVYADPPYDVEFTHYNAGGFDWEDQIRLVKYLSSLSNPVILSNQATDRIIELYESNGFDITLVDAPRFISCNGNREKAKEVIAYKDIPKKDDLWPPHLTRYK